MVFSIREAAATSVAQTSTRNSTAQKEEKKKMNIILSSKIFKIFLIFKFKMDKKFDKKKLGIIHPIMEKEPFQAQ